MVRIEYFITGHHRDQVFRLGQVDDIVRPAGNHVDGLDLVSRDLELHHFAGVDVALLNQPVTGDHDEQLPLAVMPVLSLGDARSADVDGHLSAIRRVNQLGKGASVVHVHLQCILEFVGG